MFMRLNSALVNGVLAPVGVGIKTIDQSFIPPNTGFLLQIFVMETFFTFPFELNDINKRLGLVMLGLSKVSLVWDQTNLT